MGYPSLEMTDSKEKLVVDGLVRLAEAQKFTSLSRSKLYALMQRGELPYVQLGRARRIPRRALVELAARHLIGGWGTGGNND